MTPDVPVDELTQRMQRHVLPFQGGHVTWHCLGQGPPLVLLHGGHGSWAHWVRNIEPLSRRFRVCAADLPGYGDSSAPASPTLDSLLVATCQTLDALLGAATPIALAGFSFGGLVAARLAAQRAAVSALALLGPAGHGGARRPRGELRSWREAQASWTPEVRAWLRQTLTTLQRTDLMYNRVAKVVCYSGAPSNNKPVLAFGEIRPGGGRFVVHTVKLVVSLDGRAVHKSGGVHGPASVLRFEDSAKETRVA